MICYRELDETALCPELFADFHRRQVVTKCWRRENGVWCIRDAPFVDDWTQADYQFLLDCLRHTVREGGFVYAAFAGGRLKGFVSVEPQPFGRAGDYLDLSSLHVSEELRGQGIGRTLFLAAKAWARAKGAGKLYISAHSAVESQAFYRAMGCVEALEYNRAHVEQEPYDCQLECVL